MNTTPPVPALTSRDGLIVVGVMVVGMLLAGWMVYVMRKPAKDDPNCPSGSMIRSWIAAALVMGLLVLCAGAFLLKDAATRSTLFGGLISSVGAAVAFYFSSKSTEQAQDALASAHSVIADQASTASDAAAAKAAADTAATHAVNAAAAAKLADAGAIQSAAAAAAVASATGTAVVDRSAADEGAVQEPDDAGTGEAGAAPNPDDAGQGGQA